jgi:pyruvate dehydrogenase E1 component alpha subunit
LIECKTYRWRGHHEGDPNLGSRYRDKKDIEVWKQKCPIDRLAKRLVQNKVATKKKLAAIDKEIVEQIDQAVAFAKEAEFPVVEEMYEDVYVTNEVK